MNDEANKPRAIPNLEDVVVVVCEQLDVKLEAVRGSSRRPALTAARRLISRIAKDRTTAGFPSIAQTIRGKSSAHSTCIEAAQIASGDGFVKAPGTAYDGLSYALTRERLEALVEMRARDRVRYPAAYTNPGAEKGRNIDVIA